MTKKQFIKNYVEEWNSQKIRFEDVLGHKKIRIDTLNFMSDIIYQKLSKIIKIKLLTNFRIRFNLDTSFTDDTWVVFSTDIKLYFKEVSNEVHIIECMVERWEKLEP